MHLISEHLRLRNPRFVCRDNQQGTFIVPLRSEVGAPPSRAELRQLKSLSGSEFSALARFYSDFDGARFHVHGHTEGLCVASICSLEALNGEWREVVATMAEFSKPYPFQVSGVAFATIAASGNYFVMYKGRVYYSDHDGGDDAIWGQDLDDFFRRALSDPARFLFEAGCYTRYRDGHSSTQWIPEQFLHDEP
ncbi:MAG: hypothetical protein JNK15_19555 [Planctomycetes bacterium]|nr:hypothetical protein [Planctomycetota bacterium]